MSENISDLKKFKTDKKIKVILNDIQTILKIYSLTLTALKSFSKYGSVMEVMSILQNNKTLLEIQYNKYNRMLDKK